MRGSKRPRSRPDASGRRRWELRVPLGERDPATGRPRYETRNTEPATAAEADTALAELVVNVTTWRRTRVTASPGTEARAVPVTFAELLEVWLAAKAATCKPTTVARYRDLAHRVVIPAAVPGGGRRRLGAVRLDELGVAHFDHLYAVAAATDAAPATIYQLHSVCRGAINWGRRRGFFTGDNPTTATERPALKRRRRLVVPQPGQIAALLRFEAQADPDLATAWWFTSSVGTRRSMALGVQWRDLDLDAGVVWLIGSATTAAGRLVLARSNKSHTDYVVPLDPHTVALLRAHRARAEARAELAGVALGAESYVFTYEVDGRVPMHPDTLTKTWRRAADRAGLQGVRLHDLRHMVATSLLRAGVPVEVVSKRLGHAKVSITQDIYSHVFDEMGGQHAAATMGALLAGADPDELRRGAHALDAQTTRSLKPAKAKGDKSPKGKAAKAAKAAKKARRDPQKSLKSPVVAEVTNTTNGVATTSEMFPLGATGTDG